MSLDFQQVKIQMGLYGESAFKREESLLEKRREAKSLLEERAESGAELREKVQNVVKNYDTNLRCVLPGEERLNASFLLPDIPAEAVIIAADGSQINPDRHAEVNFCLINVGAIRMHLGSKRSPNVFIRSKLLRDDQLYTQGGVLTESMVALMRDLNERKVLAELAAESDSDFVVTFTDGPLELWGSRDQGNRQYFRQSLDEYLGSLSQLQKMGVITAGYVDKPWSALVVRLLEIDYTGEKDLVDIRKLRPFNGVRDLDLFKDLLRPGERSSVFAIQSQGLINYRDELALHFFYLNVGDEDHPWLVRVEVPTWVVEKQEKINALHAVLVQQCKILGRRRYPYLLHRAHEVAVVNRDEKEQLTNMILLELRKRGLQLGEKSQKQAVKDLPGRIKRP